MATNSGHGVSRRGFISSLAAGSAALAVSSPLLAKTGTGTGALTPASAEEALLGDVSPALQQVIKVLEPGLRVLPSWTIAEVAPRAGALAVFLRSDDERELRVDICRRDQERTTGVVTTKWFELVLMNHGEGQAATPREHEQAARVIAEALRANEGALTAAPAELSTHERRVALFQQSLLFHPEPSRRG